MSNAARKARKKAGEKFEAEPKRPTGVYKTAKERQAERRKARITDEKLRALAVKVADGFQK